VAAAASAAGGGDAPSSAKRKQPGKQKKTYCDSDDWECPDCAFKGRGGWEGFRAHSGCCPRSRRICVDVTV
jgi:hypothetical protein